MGGLHPCMCTRHGRKWADMHCIPPRGFQLGLMLHCDKAKQQMPLACSPLACQPLTVQLPRQTRCLQAASHPSHGIPALFRRLGQIGQHLQSPSHFLRHLAPERGTEWVINMQDGSLQSVRQQASLAPQLRGTCMGGTQNQPSAHAKHSAPLLVDWPRQLEALRVAIPCQTAPAAVRRAKTCSTAIGCAY